MGAAADIDNVSRTCTAYDDMARKWPLLRDLMGGTMAMRAAGVTWLPKETDEKDANYQVRLNRSILFAGYSDTVEKLTGKPFEKPVTLQGELPAKLAEIAADVDGTGYGLTPFARDCFRSALKYGLTHVLVDYPRVPTTVDLGTERQLQIRPRPVLVEPTQLIGWTTSESDSGPPALTAIRIREQITVPDGKYGDKTANRIRVYTTTTWELWEEKGKEWVKIQEGTHTFGSVPLATCYFQRTGFMTADPPLEDLAWLNLAHWQSMSDQRNILRFARFAILFAKGFEKSTIEAGFTIGPAQVIGTTNDNASLQYIEHTGKAIEAGENDLRQLEQRMEVLSMQPFIRQSGDVKATSMAISESKSQSEIHGWIHELEGMLRRVFGLAAQWVGEKVPENFKVDVFSEFNLTMGASTDTGELLKAREARQISHATYLSEVKRRGLLSENLDIEKEVEAVKAEGPDLASMVDMAAIAAAAGKKPAEGEGMMGDPE